MQATPRLIAVDGTVHQVVNGTMVCCDRPLASLPGGVDKIDVSDRTEALKDAPRCASWKYRVAEGEIPPLLR